MECKGLFQAVMFFEMLVYYAAQRHEVVQADCNEDVSLKCPGVDHMDFLSVAWYKLINGTKLGIVRKRKDDPAPLPYDFPRNGTFGENYSLFLPRVKPEDSGTYECAIGANVGGQNQYPQVPLKVDECVTQADPTTQVLVLSPTSALNTTQANLNCDQQIEDLPIMWTAVGYMAVVLVKITLSLISIRVINISSSRQQQR